LANAAGNVHSLIRMIAADHVPLVSCVTPNDFDTGHQHPLFKRAPATWQPKSVYLSPPAAPTRRVRRTGIAEELLSKRCWIRR
jgi:hypothetical protein